MPIPIEVYRYANNDTGNTTPESDCEDTDQIADKPKPVEQIFEDSDTLNMKKLLYIMKTLCE